MNIKRIVAGPIETNCYLIWPESGHEALIVDPGGEGDRVADICHDLSLDPVLIVNTHAHFDHIGGNAALKRRFPGCKTAAGAPDAPAVSDPMLNLSAGFGIFEKIPPPDIILEDGDSVEAGGLTLTVRYTPGHSKGSISLLSDGADPEAVFCGDLLFADGVGRTDLPGGDGAELRHSIISLLSLCSDDTMLYPGHGPAISAGERQKNSFEGYL